MAYYVGRDVDVFWSTEHDTIGIKESAAFKLQIGSTSATSGNIVYDLAQIGKNVTKLSDVTGVDITVGAQDEDVTYMGLRNAGKIEVKKDTSITVTMKKKDRNFIQLFQGETAGSGHAEDEVGGHPARWGLTELTSGNVRIQGGDIDPKSCVDAGDTTVTSYGYRLILEFKADSNGTTGDGAAVVIPNCTISEVTHTTSNEAADEETVTFTSQVKPIISNALRASSTTSEFATNLTGQTALTDV